MLPSRLRLAGNIFVVIAALTPVICATLFLIMWWSLSTPALSQSDLPLKLYDPFYNTGVVLFTLCGVGGLSFTLLGAAYKSLRLVFQGIGGLGVTAVVWIAWGVFMAYSAMQFGTE